MAVCDSVNNLKSSIINQIYINPNLQLLCVKDHTLCTLDFFKKAGFLGLTLAILQIHHATGFSKIKTRLNFLTGILGYLPPAIVWFTLFNSSKISPSFVLLIQ